MIGMNRYRLKELEKHDLSPEEITATVCITDPDAKTLGVFNSPIECAGRIETEVVLSGRTFGGRMPAACCVRFDVRRVWVEELVPDDPTGWRIVGIRAVPIKYEIDLYDGKLPVFMRFLELGSSQYETLADVFNYSRQRLAEESQQRREKGLDADHLSVTVSFLDKNNYRRAALQ